MCPCCLTVYARKQNHPLEIHTAVPISYIVTYRSPFRTLLTRPHSLGRTRMDMTCVFRPCIRRFPSTHHYSGRFFPKMWQHVRHTPPYSYRAPLPFIQLLCCPYNFHEFKINALLLEPLVTLSLFVNLSCLTSHPPSTYPLCLNGAASAC